MKRLIVGSLVSVSLMMVAACSGDPTEGLRTGISQLTTSPSQVFVQQGRTAKVQVTAIDDQGNQISTSYDASNVGSGITVSRDETFQPVFVNDSTLQAPAEAATFQFNVNAVDLVNTTFQLNAGDKNVTIPVTVTPDPLTVVATVTTSGATAADPITVSIAPPLVFTSAATVTTDAGAGIVTNVAADGSSITFFAPPGTTTTAAITGVSLTYLTSDFTANTDVPLAISTSVPPQAGTNSPATAPDITPAAGATTAFYDGAAFGSTTCGVFNNGANCQLYKLTLPADVSLAVSVSWSNTTDLGVYVLSADGTADVVGAGSPCDVHDDGTNAPPANPEACTFDLVAGTYMMAIVNFGPFYAPPAPPPDWIAISVTSP